MVPRLPGYSPETTRDSPGTSPASGRACAGSRAGVAGFCRGSWDVGFTDLLNLLRLPGLRAAPVIIIEIMIMLVVVMVVMVMMVVVMLVMFVAMAMVMVMARKRFPNSLYIQTPDRPPKRLASNNIVGNDNNDKY